MKGRLGGRVLQFLLVVVVLLGGYLIAKRVIETRPVVRRTGITEVTPVVTVKTVRPSVRQVVIEKYGTVNPSETVKITPEVSGKVVYVAPGLKRGRTVRRGEVLLRIDDSDYRVLYAQAEAEVKRVKSELKRLKEEAEVSIQEWQRYSPGVEPPPLVAMTPQLEALEAELLAAESRLRKASLDLARTVLKAPFDAVVIEEAVGPGQYLNASQSVATLASTDAAEIRVYLKEGEVGFLDIPGLNTDSPEGSEALVHAEIGGVKRKWRGVVRRAEPVDERTRLFPVVVVVKSPYQATPPLSFGLFVRVLLKGKGIRDAVLLPEGAVQWDSDGTPFVWVVGENERLQKGKVEIVKLIEKGVLLRGLRDQQRVVLTPPAVATEGMKVRPVESP